MGILKEFRDFAVRGNVVDMAVGIIIGAAFGKVVSSLVADVMTPPLGWLMSKGAVGFEALSVKLAAAAEGKPAIEIKYGMFINQMLDFVIVALAVFFLVKAINAVKRKEAAAPPATAAPPKQERLLEEIRDLLARRP